MTPMVVQCSSCLTEFELDPAKVPANGVRARCSVCSAVIVVPAPRITAAQPPTVLAAPRLSQRSSRDRPSLSRRRESRRAPRHPRKLNHLLHLRALSR